MKTRHAVLVPCVMALAMASTGAFAQSPSPNGVSTLDPPGAIKAEGTWSLGARAGDFVFVAGMQGVDPATNRLVPDPQARIRQAFLNIKTIAQSEGAGLQDCVRLTRLCQRPATVRSHGRQGPGRALGQAALSTAHDDRGPAPVRRRYRRDRQRLLRTAKEVSGCRARSLTSWRRSRSRSARRARGR